SAPPLDLPVPIQGAGAVRSNAKDMAIFLKACSGLARTPLSASFARLAETRRPTRLAGTSAALGWFISSDEKEDIVWKSGLTNGFSTFAGYSKRTRRGAVVLANFYGATLDARTIEAGMRLINPDLHPGELRLLYVGS